jgi:hypothetical protein
MSREKLGLGDIVEKVIENVLPKTAARARANQKGCGCAERKALLNKIKF